MCYINEYLNNKKQQVASTMTLFSLSLSLDISYWSRLFIVISILLRAPMHARVSAIISIRWETKEGKLIVRGDGEEIDRSRSDSVRMLSYSCNGDILSSLSSITRSGETDADYRHAETRGWQWKWQRADAYQHDAASVGLTARTDWC